MVTYVWGHKKLIPIHKPDEPNSWFLSSYNMNCKYLNLMLISELYLKLYVLDLA